MGQDITYKTLELFGNEIFEQSEILISDKETEIEAFNFVNCTNLINISIPNTIVSVGEGAFDGCTNLTHIEIPNSVESIGPGAFSNCTNLKRITLPISSEEIKEYMFSNCEHLITLNMPHPKAILNNAFEYCLDLKDIDLSQTTHIGNYAFVGCESIENVQFNPNLSHIGKNAFFGCISLSSIEIPANVYIHSQAFANCTGLEYVVIGPNLNRSISNVDNIGLFMGCTSLKEVTIHKGIELSKDMFADCTSLMTIRYMGKRSEWEALVDKAEQNGIDWKYNTPKTMIVVCTDDTTKWNYLNGNVYEDIVEGTFAYVERNNECISIEFGCSVTNLGLRCLYNCYNLRSIYLTKHVQEISCFAMLNCINLTDIYYEGTTSDWENINKHHTVVTSKTGATIQYQDWLEGIATNEGLGGRFVVHCEDGDIEYVNDKFYVICVDTEYNIYKPGTPSQPYNFLHVEEHNEVVYNVPNIKIDGYNFVGKTLYSNVLYLQYEKVKTNENEYDGNTANDSFLGEDEVIVNPKTDTLGMSQAQIIENSLLNKICWIYFDEHFTNNDVDMLCDNLAAHGEHESQISLKREDIEEFVGYRLYSELQLYKIYNEKTNTYRNYGVEFVRFDDNNRATLTKEFEWKITGRNMLINYTDSSFTDRYFGIYKVYDELIKIQENIPLKNNMSFITLKPTEPYVWNTATFDVTSTSSTTRILGNGFKTNQVKRMMIDDVEVTTRSTYKFASKGKHTVKYEFNNLTDCSYFFYDCTNLVDIDLFALESEKVTNMDSMFKNCVRLEHIDLTAFNTSNVTNMKDMFCSCEIMKSLDVTSFNTGKVKNFQGMFARCYKIPEINVSSFDVSNATELQMMFRQMHSLTHIDLSTFNTRSMVDAHGLFEDCRILKEVDLSSFDFSKTTNFNCMFNYCYELNSIKFDRFNPPSSYVNVDYMFGRVASRGTFYYNKIDDDVVTEKLINNSSSWLPQSWTKIAI